MSDIDHTAPAGRAPFVGRDGALARLVDLYKRSVDGRGTVAVVTGEGGIGKSRLVAEFVDRAHAMGATVLSGRAAAFDRGVPFALVREMPAGLPDRMRSTAAEQVDRLVSMLARPDERDGPDERATDPTTDSGFDGAASGRPRDVLSACYELVVRLADHDPVVMFWDDLHAADEDSIVVFMRLARLVARTRVLLVATARPHVGNLHELERLVEQLELDDRGSIIGLEPLDRSDMRALVSELTGAAPDAAIIDVVYEASRGNPFFAIETTRSLMHSESLTIDDGRGRLVRTQPVLRPRTALAHRFFEVGSIETSVARILSAFGRTSVRDLDVVASIAGLPIERVVASFDRLVQEGLLVLDDGQYEFAHSILREALYDDIGPAERRRVHRIIYEHLGERFARDVAHGRLADTTALATHLAECAEPGDVEAAAVLLAAGRFTAKSAPLVSARWFAEAAALLPADSSLLDTARAGEAAALFAASLPAHAARVGRNLLATIPSGPARTRTLSDTVISLYICGDLRGAVDVIDEEATRAGALGPLLRAQRSNYLAQLAVDDGAVADHDSASPSPAVSTSVAERSITMIHDLHRAGLRGDHVTVRELIARMTDLGETSTDPTTIALFGSIAVEEAFLHHAEAASAALRRATALRSGDHRLSIAGQLEATAIVVAMLEGRWDEALEAVPDVTWGMRHCQARVLEGWVQHAACEIHIARGELRVAESIAAEFFAGTETIRQAFDATLGRLRLAAGDAAGARAHLEAALDTIDRNGFPYGAHGILDVLVDACATFGDAHGVRRHLDELESSAGSSGLSIARFRHLHASARAMGDVDAARSAVELIDSTSLYFHTATALLTLGELDAGASDALVDAHRRFGELGAVPWRQRAAAALRSRGVTIPRTVPDSGGPLSATERLLARLVRDGLSNKQIAQTMHYSVKTVEVYLTRLYAKTGYSGRLELVRAVDAGLVPTA